MKKIVVICLFFIVLTAGATELNNNQIASDSLFITMGKLFLLFLLCSTGGWVFDTFLRSVRRKRWAPIRLIPFSPLYGIASFAVVYSPHFNFDSLPIVQIAVEFLYFGILFCSFEFIAGALILRQQGKRMWDYSTRYFNIHGHTDLFHFFLWGTVGVLGLHYLCLPVTELLGLTGAIK